MQNLKVLALCILFVFITGPFLGCSYYARRDFPEKRYVNYADVGSNFTFDKLEGKTALIYYWGTWCMVCKTELGILQHIYEYYRPEGFAVIAIALKSKAVDVQTFVRHSGITFPVILDKEDVFIRRFDIDAIPESYMLGKNGEILALPSPESLSSKKEKRLIKKITGPYNWGSEEFIRYLDFLLSKS